MSFFFDEEPRPSSPINDDWSAWVAEEDSRWRAEEEAAATARKARQQRITDQFMRQLWRGNSREGSPERPMEELLDQREQAAKKAADDLERGRFDPLGPMPSSRSASPVPPAALQAGFDMAVNRDHDPQEVLDYIRHDEEQEIMAIAAAEDVPPVVYERRKSTRDVPEWEQFTEEDYPPVGTKQRVESHLRPGVFTDLELTPTALRGYIQNQTDPALVASMFGVEPPTGKHIRVRRQDIVESVPIRQPSRAASVSSSASESPAPRRPGKGVVLPRATLEEVMASECANGCLRVTGTPKMYVCVPNDDNTPIKDITQYVNLGRQVATTKHPCEFNSFDAYKSDPKIKAMSSSKRWKAPKWNQYCCH